MALSGTKGGLSITARSATYTVVTLAIIAMSACGPQRKPVSTPQASGHRTIAQGYSLLYGITSQQRDLKKLLLIKFESDAVDAVVSDIADTTGEISAELEDMAKRYPALTIDTQFLPEVEVKAREAIASETTDDLLDKSGKLFERLLLLKQSTALNTERAIARVMVGLETDAERRKFWSRTGERLAGLQTKVDGLLERDYFCGRERAR